MTIISPFEKKLPLSGKYQVAQYILGNDFRKKIDQHEEISDLFNDELRILEGLYGLAFDTGLARIRSYKNRTVPPIYILRRTVGFGKLFANEDNLENGSLEIIFVELHGLWKMDKAIDEEGYHAADFVLNTVAQEIQIAVAESQASLIDDRDGEDIACRYTGSDFIIILRNRSEAYREKLIKKIEAKLEILRGYYMEENGEIISQSLDFSIYTRETPEEETYKKIYRAFLKRAIILNENEIKNIQKRMKHDDLDFLNHSIYPSEVKLLDEKVAFILQNQPELAVPLKIANILDGREEKERTKLTLNFIQEIFFNKSLGKNIYSFVNLQWRIAQGDLAYLWVIECKFLKEINEALSFVDGDEMLEKVYNLVHSIFTEEEKKKIALFQRGGIFIIGLNKTIVLSEQTKEKLQHLSSVMIDEETNLTVPLGRSKIELTPKQDNETEAYTVERTHRDLSTVLDAADTNWYYRIIDIIDDSISEYKSLLEAEEWRVKEEMKESNKMTLNYLVWHFFHGKNAYSRIQKILTLIEGREELTQIFKSIA